MKMIDKQALHDDLTELFINYQHRLDNPMPSVTETRAAIILKYRNDWVFHRKVDSLVYGVMQVVNKHIDEQGE